MNSCDEGVGSKPYLFSPIEHGGDEGQPPEGEEGPPQKRKKRQTSPEGMLSIIVMHG